MPPKGPKSDKPINSVGTDDAGEALSAFKNEKASLYFGSSLEFRNTFCKALSYQMGFDFAGYFPGNSASGELSAGDT